MVEAWRSEVVDEWNLFLMKNYVQADVNGEVEEARKGIDDVIERIGLLFRLVRIQIYGHF